MISLSEITGMELFWPGVCSTAAPFLFYFSLFKHILAFGAEWYPRPALTYTRRIHSLIELAVTSCNTDYTKYTRMDY